MEKLKPVGKKIIVQVEDFTRTRAGLIKPATSTPEYFYATIESIGPDVTTLAVGERIVFSPRSGATIKLNNILYKILEPSEVIAVVVTTDEVYIQPKEDVDANA